MKQHGAGIDKRRHILLIQPEQARRFRVGTLIGRLWQPLDLANSAGRLEQDGYGVRIIDNRVEMLSPSRIADIADGFDKVFVTSAAFDRWQCPPVDIQDFFNITKLLDKNKLYIMGPHVTERPETFLKQTGARIAILGEPEDTLVTLVRHDQASKIPESIGGIAWLQPDGSLALRANGQQGSTRVTWPRPAFHHLDMNRYHYPLMKRPFTIMEGSRGCPFHCRFCYKGMHPDAYIQKDPLTLAEEVLDVRDRFGIRNIYFMDLEFGLNRQSLETFCSALIQRKAGVNWCCQTRVTDVDDHLLSLMGAAGCSLIHFGAESGVQRILDWTGKHICLSDCEKAVTAARRANIRTALFFGLGFPGESMKDMDDTVAWAIHLNPTYASFHMLMPVPGTELQKETGFDPESLACSRYPSYNAQGHDYGTLRKKVRQAYLRFYGRPGYMIKALSDQGILKRQAFELFLRGIGRL